MHDIEQKINRYYLLVEIDNKEIDKKYNDADQETIIKNLLLEMSEKLTILLLTNLIL